jgi:hypothetical protein
VRLGLEAVTAFCSTYNTGTAAGPDYDGADALVALFTAIVDREGHSRVAIAPPPYPA